jgi:5-methylcytosine-specific restriction endonuclease McrA
MGMGRVLVLNASYEPLNITTWRRASVMVLKGKAEGLEHDTRRQLRPDVLLPTVIRLRQFVRVPFRPLALTRRNVFHRDGHRCQYCGYSGDQLSIDHVIPRSRGGASSWENCVLACKRINQRKGDRTPDEAGLQLLRAPSPPRELPASAFIRNTHGIRDWEAFDPAVTAGYLATVAALAKLTHPVTDLRRRPTSTDYILA